MMVVNHKVVPYLRVSSVPSKTMQIGGCLKGMLSADQFVSIYITFLVLLISTRKLKIWCSLNCV